MIPGMSPEQWEEFKKGAEMHLNDPQAPQYLKDFIRAVLADDLEGQAKAVDDANKHDMEQIRKMFGK